MNQDSSQPARKQRILPFQWLQELKTIFSSLGRKGPIFRVSGIFLEGLSSNNNNNSTPGSGHDKRATIRIWISHRTIFLFFFLTGRIFLSIYLYVFPKEWRDNSIMNSSAMKRILIFLGAISFIEPIAQGRCRRQKWMKERFSESSL